MNTDKKRILWFHPYPCHPGNPWFKFQIFLVGHYHCISRIRFASIRVIRGLFLPTKPGASAGPESPPLPLIDSQQCLASDCTKECLHEELDFVRGILFSSCQINGSISLDLHWMVLCEAQRSFVGGVQR